MTVTSACYCWRADFTSTTGGVPPASDSASDSATSTGECFEINPASLMLDTAAVAAAVAKGSAVQDNATLSGTSKQPGTNGGTTPNVAGSQYPSINATNGANAGGAIAFTLVNNDCTTTTTGGTGDNPQSLTVNQTPDRSQDVRPGQLHTCYHRDISLEGGLHPGDR